MLQAAKPFINIVRRQRKAREPRAFGPLNCVAEAGRVVLFADSKGASCSDYIGVPGRKSFLYSYNVQECQAQFRGPTAKTTAQPATSYRSIVHPLRDILHTSRRTRIQSLLVRPPRPRRLRCQRGGSEARGSDPRFEDSFRVRKAPCLRKCCRLCSPGFVPLISSSCADQARRLLLLVRSSSVR